MRPLILLLLVPGHAAAQSAAPDPLSCAATEGGVECTATVPDGVRDDAVLYCLAEDAAGEPLANSTISSDAGTAVFNTLTEADIERIAGVTCREQ
ncbi:hypothetical protein [uncultured Jannaschia sp.]|uniref:hypothetical protein n=1 Tax=uncultured Jannaschia sp. TaxID=293347 RepID=UPI00262463E2|nr:hypothetical protein [uncultured Jannaschia sp.]